MSRERLARGFIYNVRIINCLVIMVLLFLMHVLLKIKTPIVCIPIFILGNFNPLLEISQVLHLTPLKVCVGKLPEECRCLEFVNLKLFLMNHTLLQ